jgi:hypothetical protein
MEILVWDYFDVAVFELGDAEVEEVHEDEFDEGVEGLGA